MAVTGGRVRRWLWQYLHAVMLLRAYGEPAWPWHVRFVWSHVGEHMPEVPVWRWQR